MVKASTPRAGTQTLNCQVLVELWLLECGIRSWLFGAPRWSSFIASVQSSTIALWAWWSMRYIQLVNKHKVAFFSGDGRQQSRYKFLQKYKYKYFWVVLEKGHSSWVQKTLTCFPITAGPLSLPSWWPTVAGEGKQEAQSLEWRPESSRSSSARIWWVRHKFPYLAVFFNQNNGNDVIKVYEMEHLNLLKTLCLEDCSFWRVSANNAFIGWSTAAVPPGWEKGTLQQRNPTRENFPNADHHWGNTLPCSALRLKAKRMEIFTFFEELIHQTELAPLHKIRDIYFWDLRLQFCTRWHGRIWICLCSLKMLQFLQKYFLTYCGRFLNEWYVNRLVFSKAPRARHSGGSRGAL